MNVGTIWAHIGLDNSQLKTSAKESEDVISQMGGSIVETIKTAAMAAAAAFTVSEIIDLTKEAIQVIDNLKLSTIQIAAQITTMQGSENIAQHYKEAKEYAGGLQLKLKEIDAQSFANNEQLQAMVRTMAMQGVLLDYNNKKQVESFTALSNAIAMSTQGQNANIQMFQETRALMSGQVTMNSQLAVQIDALAKKSGLYVNGLKDIVALGRQHGDTLERILPFLAGVNAASSDISKTWQAVTSSFATAKDMIMEAGFDSLFEEAVHNGGLLVAYLKDHAELIGGKIHQGWLAVRGIFEGCYSILSAFKEPLEFVGKLTSTILYGWGLLASSVFPPLMERIGSFILSMIEAVKQVGNLVSMGAKAVVGDWSGAAESYKSAQANGLRAGQLMGQAFKSGLAAEIGDRSSAFIQAGQVKHGDGKLPPVPKLPPSSTLDADKDAERAAEYRQRLIEKYNDAYERYSKAFDDRMASNARAQSQANLASLKDQYDQGLIITKAYFDEKLKIELEANNRELAAKAQTVHDLGVEVYNLDQSPYAEDQIKAMEKRARLEKEMSDLQKLMSDRGKLETTNRIESRKALEQDAKTYSDIKIQLLELTGQYEKAAQARADFEKTTSSYKALPAEQQAQKDFMGGINVFQGRQRQGNELRDIRNTTSALANNTVNVFGDVTDRQKDQQAKLEYEQRQQQLTSLMDLEEEMNGKMTEKYQAYLEQRSALEKQYAAQVKATEKSRYDGQISALGTAMGQMASVLSQGTKKQFEMSKAFAIAAALINTYQAASAAYRAGVEAGGIMGSVMGMVQMTVAIATGMMQVRNIMQQKYEGRAFGGPVQAGKMVQVNETGMPEMFSVGGKDFLLGGHADGYVTAANKIGGRGVTVNISNYGTSKEFDVQQLSEGEIRVIARDEARNTVHERAPRVIANEIADPNSQVSKAMARNVQAPRRRNG